MGTITYGFATGPFGDIVVASSPWGLCDVQFLDHNRLETIHELGRRWGTYTPTTQDNGLADTVQRVVFEGSAQPLTLDLRGTEFQVAVWRAVAEVPFGATASYQDIANRIGSPGAVRAVASAIGQNPIAMLVPCHRIVHSDGTLGEYHWGKELKRRLIDWEAARAAAGHGGPVAVDTRYSTTPLAREMANDTLDIDDDELF